MRDDLFTIRAELFTRLLQYLQKVHSTPSLLEGLYRS